MTTHRKWLLGLVGGLVITSLVVALATDSPAQATKKDAKKTDAKTDKKKESKVGPPPANFPARVDSILPGPGTANIKLIDEQIQDGWKKNNTFPSERCTDYEFIRRASLDIIGRIPSVEEVNRFMKHPTDSRRSWLINEMLEGSTYDGGAQYAQNLANLWTILLVTRTGSNKHEQGQINDWLYENFKGDDKEPADWSKVAKELISGTGVTNKNRAVNFLLHNMGEEIKQDTAKNGRWDMVPATSRTTRLFLGIRTQCVQCHDHPFNGEWKQENFWGINAFFRELDTPRGRPLMMVAKKKAKGVKVDVDYDLLDNKGFNTSGMVMYERRNTVYLATDSTFLDGKKIPKNWKGTRRDALAKFVTESPFFAKAFVNRMWGHFMGKSFTKDNVDDFGDGNPASHPELLDQLSEDWAKKYAHNPKVLIRWICNSQAYGLSSKANKWNDQMDHEPLFARMLLKPMTPEQMFFSIVYATTPQDGNFKKRLEKRLDDKSKQDWLDKLVVNFGNDEGEEGSYSGTVVQALLLMNGQDINNAISEKDGAVDAVVKKRGSSYASTPMAVRDMYVQVLSREPTQKELRDFATPGFFNFRGTSKTQPTTPQFWTNYYQDVMWALINSNEFIMNH